MIARAARRGTAVEIDDSGRTHLIRGVELARHIGAVELDQIRAAAIDGEVLSIELASGAVESINVGSLFDDVPTLAITGARLATCDGDPGDPLGLASDRAVVCGGGRILWIGPTGELAGCSLDLAGAERIAAAGALLTPGLIDCHTHPLFGGDRAGEFAMRAAGADYREIAAAGGGIRATVGPTRAASFADHVALTSERCRRALAAGTTTLEAKSGYDLTVDGELRLLEVAGVVDSLEPIDLVPTLLGAHVIPPELDAGSETDRAAYVAEVAGPMVRGAAERRLAASVDVYCDDGAFTLAEARHILEAARAAGLDVRGHVGQFADLGGPQLLAELGACSGDHLEQISTDGMAAMAAHGVVAVMLPGACVQLRMKPPPVAALRDAGVIMAVASDMNPGTSFCETLAVPMWLATTHYQMTVPEVWRGVTREAARALGRHDIGVIAVGARADLVLWQTDEPAEVPYRYGANLVDRVIKSGRIT
jgi:imidazolonepropionase